MSAANYPDAFIGCNTTITDNGLCTLDTCCLAQSSFLYRPSFGGNLFFVILFAALIIPHLWLGIKKKTWGFMAGMVLGLLFEVIGYVGRIQLHSDPFSNGAFLIYLIMLTIAPVFLTAAIYLCLSRIIILYGAHHSPLQPRTIAIFFMCSDFLSLVLQAVGGALAETASTKESGQSGINTMIAGLLLQAISLTVFSGVWTWFMLRVRSGVSDQSPEKIATRTRMVFKLFQVALMLATVAIIVRSIYRVAELWGGFEGDLWNNETDFMILDGAMVALAVLLLTGLHPGIAFGQQWHAANWSVRSRRSKERVPSQPSKVDEREMQVMWK